MACRRQSLTALLWGFSIIAMPGTAWAEEPSQPTFASGYAGSLPSDPRDRSRTYFNMPQVRDLIRTLESGPLPAAEVEQRLSGSSASIADLVRTMILRPAGAGYALGFNYFTPDDMRRIHAIADRDVPSLVGAYLRHRRDFDRIFAQYPVRSVSKARLANVVLAGFALNWDGLATTASWGYRRPLLAHGPGWQYSFWAEQKDPGYSQHGFIWGSSTLFALHDNLATRPVDFTFSSYGDPYSDPRMNFPDLFTMSLKDMAPDVRAAASVIGTRDESYMGQGLTGVLGPSRARSIGPMLFALRRAPLDATALSHFVEPEDRARSDGFIQLLQAAEYIRKRRDGRFELIAPVLDRQDAPMLQKALALHRNILRDWLQRHYPQQRRELAALTAARQGVPFESLFTQIWHEYFGLATRQLVHAGMIEDPYAGYRKHPGSVPVLWRRSIYYWNPG